MAIRFIALLALVAVAFEAVEFSPEAAPHIEIAEYND